MALEKRVYPYEVLIRWSGGEISGAHFVEIEEIVDGGEVINERLGSAVPIPLDRIAEVYPEAQALADVSRLLAEKQAMEVELKDLRSKVKSYGIVA